MTLYVTLSLGFHKIETIFCSEIWRFAGIESVSYFTDFCEVVLCVKPRDEGKSEISEKSACMCDK